MGNSYWLQPQGSLSTPEPEGAMDSLRGNLSSLWWSVIMRCIQALDLISEGVALMTDSTIIRFFHLSRELSFSRKNIWNVSGSNVSLSLKCSLWTIDANYPELPYSANTLNFLLWSICVVMQDAKACHFQYYKYLLQILVLMLSLKRKETLLRVQCTGDSYQYFSSKVKHYMLPGSCPFALFLKFSVLPLEKLHVLPCSSPHLVESREFKLESSMGCLPIDIFICTVRGNVICEGKAQSECGSC